MSYNGSSRIRSIVFSITGGVGPTGEKGNTGDTGSFITGPAGPIGNGIVGFTYSSSTDGLTFYSSDGSAFYFIGTKGGTGDGISANPPLIRFVGSGIEPLKNEQGISGYTLFFRSITFSSGISASQSGDTIFVQENLSATGSFDIGQLLYVDFSSTNNQYFIDSATNTKYSEKIYSGITYSNLEIYVSGFRDILDENNFNYSTGSSQATTHTGLTMIVDSAFYGITGTENGLTSGSWSPYFKFRSSYFDVDGNSGATVDLINFLPLSPYTKKISFSSPVGSCCFYCNECEGSVLNRKCVDYVSKAYCESVSGRWSISNCYNRQNAYDCHLRRACCVNGRCVNTSKLKCDQMGGTFCSSKICGDGYTCGSECSSTILPVIGIIYCCCTDGIKTEVTDPAACLGTIIEGDCSLVNCCDHGNTGACCLPTGECLHLTAQECMARSGSYRGTGITCDSISCC
jgi:hypothetical protein